MNIEERILKLAKCEFKDKQIIGIRFLKKVEENKWNFRFTYKDGDYLSMSDEFSAEFKGLEMRLKEESIFKSPGVFVIERDSAKKEKINK